MNLPKKNFFVFFVQEHFKALLAFVATPVALGTGSAPEHAKRGAISI